MEGSLFSTPRRPLSQRPFTLTIKGLCWQPTCSREIRRKWIAVIKEGFKNPCLDLHGAKFVQTIEIYKILGVQKVYIYNTSCGPDLEKVLQYYKEEGILEVEPWPIDHFLNPSKGWNFQEHKACHTGATHGRAPTKTSLYYFPSSKVRWT
ncbi:glycosyltransferase family 92 protein F13G3.3-like [Arapaima gigas]